MLPYGTADIITAAVFIVYGVEAKTVEHHGELVTYGVNDMVLDTWGKVEKWVSYYPMVSYGPSGIGFVNFGTVKDFMAQDITTYGLGSRGLTNMTVQLKILSLNPLQPMVMVQSAYKSANPLEI